MTLRRYASLKSSAGTTWPPEVRTAIYLRDGYRCVSERAHLPVTLSCWGNAGLELDHVRASGGVGMKSRSTLDNGVALCPPCHRWKTDNGRVARPLLLDYIERVTPEPDGCPHVDPQPQSCAFCRERVKPALDRLDSKEVPA